MSEDPQVTPRLPLAHEPRLTWFLRIGTLDSVLTVTAIAALVTQAVMTTMTDAHPLTFALLGLAGAGLALGRRRRGVGLGLVVLATCAAALFTDDYVVLWTVSVMMLLSVTLRGTKSLPAGVLTTLGVYGAVVVREQAGLDSGSALLAASLCVSATAIGSAVRSQARYLDAMRERALEAIATRDLAVERGVARERLRIAQDLHDAVGHEIAVVGIGLGAAEVQLERNPEAARGALQGAREGVQRVLRETQQILDILRHGAGGSIDAVADVRHLGALVDTLRAASFPVDADLPDSLPPLDPAVSAAAYRIAQESLTNAQRHGSGRIRLTGKVLDEHLVITVENDTISDSAPSSRGSGYGLIGMQERAASVGGRLDIEETPRRFRVTAVLGIDKQLDIEERRTQS
ncbi:sensor histidine kinase [Brachybacterium sp. AOP29-B2-41]|uniref:sensor histidine kinase n=1 Tax=Brachybacterium sp. AOP29-B2-41 TaxID=3457704 RepID=UPI0040340E01